MDVRVYLTLQLFSRLGEELFSGKGMDLTEFTNVINYIETLRDEGTIEVMTYKDFVNECLEINR